jgi:alkanesulfonate monooxygenase SsuD/methylene tetrahydromethanopterin reductase-like flavin-dependent oxidoreductase (luciferase family)
MGHHGTAFETRFKKLKEQVAAVRTIWTEEEAEFHGDFVRFDKIWCHPKPVQQPGPPIVLGGGSPQAMARAVAYCDGWIPIHNPRDFARMQKTLAELDRRLAEKGRDRKRFSVSVYGVQQKPEVVARYRELGVDRVIFLVRPEPRDQVLAKLDRIAALL